MATVPGLPKSFNIHVIASAINELSYVILRRKDRRVYGIPGNRAASESFGGRHRVETHFQRLNKSSGNLACESGKSTILPYQEPKKTLAPPLGCRSFAVRQTTT